MKKNEMYMVVAVLLLIILVVNGALLLWLSQEKSVEVNDGSVVMRVVFEPSCTDCFNATQYGPEMERLGVVISDTEEIDRSSRAGKKLIKKYALTRLPAVIFSEELGQNAQIASAWDRVGTIADDGSYVLQGSNPPFLDLESNEVRGFVNIIYLDDASCEECYDPLLHKQVLQKYGMIFESEKNVDVGSDEGAALIKQYNITHVPTILLRGDMNLYPAFEQVWATVGRFDDDGTAIFTQLDSLGEAYEDVATGEVITPSATSPSATS